MFVNKENIVKTAFLQSERLYLRPLDADDLDRCLRWINDPEVLQYLGRRRPTGREQETQWLANQYKSDDQFSLAIVLKDGDRHIGNCGFNDIEYEDRKAAFGILIGEKDTWSSGYGTEATRLILTYGFRTLGLHRIALEVYSNNPRAQAAYERAGFRLEGTQRESYYCDGQYFDTYIMAILRTEWEEGADEPLEQ